MSTAYSLLNLSTESFIEFLKNQNIKRFYFVYDTDNNSIISSHPQLSEITEFLNNDQIDFDKHEGLFFEVDSEFDVIHSAAVHRTNRGQAAGAFLAI